jgi:hypothetical protein
LVSTYELGPGGTAWMIYTIGAVSVGILAHIVMAVAVHQDASWRQQRGLPMPLGDRSIWTFLTLVIGIAGLVAYWLINASALREKEGAELSP